MASMHYLKAFDKAQLWRFFVDGRLQKKYEGWVGYEAGERGSVQALMNGFAYMLEHFDLSRGLSSTYLMDLHKVCMLNVETSNLKSSPGDLRYLNAGMPFFAVSTTFENLKEILQERRGDGTVIFNTKKYAKTAEEFDADTLYAGLLKEKRINYRNWYPNLDKATEAALQKQKGIREFYSAKHHVQMLFADKMDAIVQRFNRDIRLASTDDARLDCIVALVRHLELLHPFPDGNCRTFACITLNHLLLYYEMLPATLYNPNYDGELSSAEFKEEIKKGMALTAQLLEDQNAAVYDFAVSEMSEKNRKHFLKMAENTLRRIEAYREVYLTPRRAAHLCQGKWYRADPYIRFAQVGDHNTYLKDSLYFLLALDAWKEEGRETEVELRRLENRGVRAIVTDDDDVIRMTSLPVLLVADVKKAYVQAAVRTRTEVGCKTVLITGTEGKTGAKTQLYQLLKPQTTVHANINSANTEIPVLRSLINLSGEDEVELNEVSVGRDEAQRVARAKWVNPDICLFTHIGPNHMDMHKTMANLVWAKSSVVEGLREGGTCIVNRDMDYFSDLADAIGKRRPGTSLVTFGTGEDDDGRLIGADFDNEKNGWKVAAVIDKKRYDYFVPMIQGHIPLSSVGILLCVSRMGYDVAEAAAAYENVGPYETMGQLSVLHKPEGDVLFYDQSRRGGSSGMRSAFSDLARLKKRGKVVALVGGISILKESDWTKEAHGELAELINRSPIDRLYTTGPYMQYVHDALEHPSRLVRHSDDLDALATALADDVDPGDTLFIIGSAYLYLGRVADRIKKRYPVARFDAARAYRFLPPERSAFREAFRRSGMRDEYAFKADLLNRFFREIQSLFAARFGVTCIDASLNEKGKRYVFNEAKCRAWFYNNTPMKKEKGREFFGTFFDIGDPQYLLHVHLATHHMHIGFVRYEREGGSYGLVKIPKEELAATAAAIGGGVQPRAWWMGWCSIDCGQAVDPDAQTAYAMLQDFGHSDCFAKVASLLEQAKQVGS